MSSKETEGKTRERHRVTKIQIIFNNKIESQSDTMLPSNP